MWLQANVNVAFCTRLEYDPCLGLRGLARWQQIRMRISGMHLDGEHFTQHSLSMLLLGLGLLVLGLMLLRITLPAFRRAAPAWPRPEQKLGEAKRERWCR
jgi:hypothetical protein